MKPEIEALAAHVAMGGAVAEWARSTGRSVRNVYRWTDSDEFRARVREIRSHATNAALGKLTVGVGRAVDRMIALVDSAGADSVQLAAARAVLQELRDLGGHVEFEERIARLEAIARKGEEKP